MSEKNLIETQLQQAKASKTSRSLLINGKLRLTGIIKDFDNHMVVMSCNNTIHLIYRHSITDVSVAKVYARPEAAAARKPAYPREKEREKAGAARPSFKERTPRTSPAPRNEAEKPAAQPQTSASSMPGALGEELRKWLQRSGK